MEKLSDGEKKLVEENLGVIYYTLNLMNVHIGNEVYEDLENACMLWLCLAAIRFKKESGTKFSTYAIGFLKHEILWYQSRGISVRTNLSIDGEDYRLICDKDEIAQSEEKILATEIKAFMKKELEPEENAVLLLVAEGKRAAEIAKKLGLTVDRVRLLKDKAIKKIKIFIDDGE